MNQASNARIEENDLCEKENGETGCGGEDRATQG
jgi:hypothetical protein